MKTLDVRPGIEQLLSHIISVNRHTSDGYNRPDTVLGALSPIREFHRTLTINL